MVSLAIRLPRLHRCIVDQLSNLNVIILVPSTTFRMDWFWVPSDYHFVQRQHKLLPSIQPLWKTCEPWHPLAAIITIIITVIIITIIIIIIYLHANDFSFPRACAIPSHHDSRWSFINYHHCNQWLQTTHYAHFPSSECEPCHPIATVTPPPKP